MINGHTKTGLLPPISADYTQAQDSVVALFSAVCVLPFNGSDFCRDLSANG